MRTATWSVFAIILSACLITGAQAGDVGLDPATLASLIGAGPVGGAVPLMTTDMSNDILHAEVLSQAFATESGDYVYLYQLNNTGMGSDSSIELFTLVPFIGAGADPSAGWLTGVVPDGFLSDGLNPEDDAFVNAGGVLSFYFTERTGAVIGPGQHSSVLYAMSTYGPDTVELIVGNLIGARVGSGDVIGPVVPEPSTLVLIGMGLAALVAVRRRMG